MTDGRNNRVPPEPKDEADLLKADNKIIIVVAIGSAVNMTALNEIASSSGVFQTTFSTLGNIIDSLTTRICTRKIFSFFL
jgi:uncharacterized protein YegL